MALRAAVFDFDGVIVDSEPLHFRSLHDALMSEGVEITREEYWAHLLAYDDRHLYIALRCFDPEPRKIRAPFVERDQVIGTDDLA